MKVIISGEYENKYEVEDQLQPQDSLIDQDVDDILDRGLSYPEYKPHIYREHETLEQREAAANIDRNDCLYPEIDNTSIAGRVRAGRLIHEDQIFNTSHNDILAQDEGIDGGAASAEEAAMHIVDDITPLPY